MVRASCPFLNVPMAVASPQEETRAGKVQIMETKQIKELKKGEIFRIVKRKTNGKAAACGVSVKVYVRGDYDRSERKYYAHDYFDICDFRAFKPTQEVTTDFEF